MPIDPARLNAVGDLVLTDPRGTRARRPAATDAVRPGSPSRPGHESELARRTEKDHPSIEEHLRELESVGLVGHAVADDGDVYWTTSVKGIYFEIPDEPEGQHAARALSNAMLAKDADLPTAWLGEGRAEARARAGVRAAGLFNARVDLTAVELRDIQDELERLLGSSTYLRIRGHAGRCRQGQDLGLLPARGQARHSCWPVGRHRRPPRASPRAILARTVGLIRSKSAGPSPLIRRRSPLCARVIASPDHPYPPLFYVFVGLGPLCGGATTYAWSPSTPSSPQWTWQASWLADARSGAPRRPVGHPRRSAHPPSVEELRRGPSGRGSRPEAEGQRRSVLPGSLG